MTTMKNAHFAWRRKLTIIAATSLLGISSLALAQTSAERSSTSGATTSGMSQGNMGTSSTNGAYNGMANGSMGGTHSGPMMKAMEPSDQKMKSMSMTGNIDKDFAMMMREHHQGAIDMAQVELSDGKNAEMRRMARKIIDNNKKEQAQFDKWLSQQKASKGSTSK